MKICREILPLAAVVLFAGEANAQSTAQQAELAEARAREMAVHEADMAQRLREAEQRMEIAAREIAEITRERLPQIARLERRIQVSDKPRLGITIDGSEDGPVKGVEIRGVTPESAADDAGLRTGDIITAINSETMKAESGFSANQLLLAFVKGVEEGDVLEVDYLRNGNAGTVELSPRVVEGYAFARNKGSAPLRIPSTPGIAIAPGSMLEFTGQFGFPFAGSAWGNMELVELTDGLGKYFGAASGLLVVRAPDSDGIELRDGDVIQSIDGRKPKDVRHAMRILSSYQSGETLQLSILREKKQHTIEVEVPSNHRGSLFAPPAISPVRMPTPPTALPEKAST